MAIIYDLIHLSRNPFPVIIGCVVLAGVCIIPIFVDFKQETEGLELWVPRNSDYYLNAKWLQSNLPPSSFRFNGILVTTEGNDILTNEGINILLELHNAISSINTTANGITWQDMCAKTNTGSSKKVCAETSLLELWATDGSYDSINGTAHSLHTGRVG